MSNIAARLKTGGPRQAVTDAYIFLMLLIFPLFTGFRGYAAITISKYLFFVTATAAWLLALAVFSGKKGRLPRSATPAQLCAVIFMAACCLSAALSPYRLESLIGSGRYDGLVTLLLSALIFLGVSAFGCFRPCHAAAFGVSSTVCCAVSALQLLGLDPLWLFPGDLCYYDAHIRFTGEFLGTIGNVNLLSSMLCLAIPLFFGLAVTQPEKAALLYNIPLFSSVLILISSKVSGGVLAAGLCALAAPALLVRSIPALRRSLISAAVCLAAIAMALSFIAVYTDGTVLCSFGITPLSAVCLVLAAMCLILFPLTRLVRRPPPERSLRLFFLTLGAAALIALLGVIWFWRGTSGTMYELSQAMRGQLEDGFGSSRILIWRKVLDLVPEHLLLGGGPGTLALRLDVSFSRYVPDTGNIISTFVDNAHNVYLQLLADTGVLGLLSYLALLVCSLLVCVRRGHTGSSAPLLLAVACYCIQDFFGLGLCIVSPLFWIFLGLTQSGGNIHFDSED